MAKDGTKKSHTKNKKDTQDETVNSDSSRIEISNNNAYSKVKVLNLSDEYFQKLSSREQFIKMICQQQIGHKISKLTNHF